MNHKTFVWGAEFHTGMGAVDEQHHALIDLFNQLSESLLAAEDPGSQTVQTTFTRLMNYAGQHFAAEEAVMRKAGVDPRYIALHLKLHDEFSEQVRAMWSARSAFANPAEVFLNYLTSWLCLHVLGVDQSLARQLARIRAGESAQQAYERELLRSDDHSAEAMIKALRNTHNVASRLSMDLLSANRFLEERVAARTAELEQANAALREANLKLEVHSQTDGLLGIANRRYFDLRLQDEWNRAIRERSPLGLLMLDVDFFKNYNDHYGHLAGDSCLKSIVAVVSERMMRAVDLLARYGGEEFVVILPNTALPGAQQLAQDLCAAVAALKLPHAASSIADHVTISIGAAAILPDRHSSPEQIVAAADQALYAAKQAGRNRVSLA